MGNISSSNYATLAAAEGLVLILTDSFLTPMLATSEVGYLLTYFLQAWIFLKVRDMLTPPSTKATFGMGVGPVIAIA